MKNFNELIKEIKVRPGIYLGEKSLSKLKSFLDGYFVASGDYTYGNKNFFEYLKVNYPKAITKTWYGWEQVILAHSSSQEEAFDKFFVLYEDFLGEKTGNLSVLDDMPKNPIKVVWQDNHKIKVLYPDEPENSAEFRQMLAEIRNNPNLLGEKSFKLLAAYISGYRYSRTSYAEAYWEDEFKEFAQKKILPLGSADGEVFATWRQIFEENFDSDITAFDTFFEVLDEFWKSN